MMPVTPGSTYKIWKQATLLNPHLDLYLPLLGPVVGHFVANVDFPL